MARRSKSQAAPASMLPIAVDPGFLRLYADQALVMHLGRDIDFAFLTIGSKLERIQRTSAENEHDVLRLHPQLNEVARVRMNPGGAASMAMEILQGLIKAGVVDKPGLLKSIEETAEPDDAEDMAKSPAPVEADMAVDGDFDEE